MFRPSQQQHDLGFKGTPSLPNQKWHVHDSDRPHPAAITPGSGPGAAPADAVVLFEGKDLPLQDHNHPVRFRNIWIRPLGQYDTPER